MGIEWRRLESPQRWRILPPVGQDVTPISGEKLPRRNSPLALDAKLGATENCAGIYKAGVSPQTAKRRKNLVPQKCACQAESKNSSAQQHHDARRVILWH